MSSSVFIETASRRSPLLAAEQNAEHEDADVDVDLFGEPSNVAADANLVVVIKNDRVHVDSDGLERFIEDKTINSLSVIRITSPTPSMEEEDARAENEEERADKGSSENENSDVDISCESVGSENSTVSAHLENEELGAKSKKQKHKKNKQKEVVGIQVENYFLRKDAEILLKSVMQKSGLIKPKRTARQEIWLQNIMNDHCYTSWDTTIKPADVPANSATAAVTATTTTTSVSKESRILKRQKELTEESKSILKPSKLTDEDEEDDDQHTSNAEEEGDSEYESEDFDSSDTDNDRDSDLDFKVNNNSSKKTTRKKRKNLDKKSSRRSINFKHKNVRRLSNETEEPSSSTVKVRARKSNEHMMRLQPRLDLKRINTVKVEKDIPLVPIVAEEKPKEVIVINPHPFMLPKYVKTTQPQEIIVEKKLLNPIGIFTDLNALIEKKLEPTTKLETNQKFVQLEPASVHELPVQISIQTHASKSELAAEADKQLDLINSFVTHELQQTAVKPVESTQVESKIADKSIPAIVKMLEGEDTEDHAANNINAVDLMPPDILDHVTDLLKNDPAFKQVVIDDSVFSEQDESAVMNVSDHDTTQLAPQIGDIIKIETPMKQEPAAAIEPVTPYATTTIQQCMTSTPIQAPVAAREVTQTPTVTEDWKTIKLGNGRVISLPPMEAPTTRSRKRAQNTSTSINLDMSINSVTDNDSTTQTKLQLNATPKTASNDSKPAAELATSVNKSRGKKSANKSKMPNNMNDSLQTSATDLSESQGEVDDDDPNK